MPNRSGKKIIEIVGPPGRIKVSEQELAGYLGRGYKCLHEEDEPAAPTVIETPLSDEYESPIEEEDE